MEFISEDDLNSFEGWLKYQAIDAATTPPEEESANVVRYNPTMVKMTIYAQPG